MSGGTSSLWSAGPPRMRRHPEKVGQRLKADLSHPMSLIMILASHPDTARETAPR